MVSSFVQVFQTRVAASPELQAKLEAAQSPVEVLVLARELGFELTGDDFKEIAQNAYQQWILALNPETRPFFEQAQAMEALNTRLKTCQTVDQVLALAAESGFALQESDLVQAAAIAQTVPGFSFEKLWFRRLGLL